LNSFSNGIIKNLFLNVNRQTEALTLILSRGVERVEKERFNGTPHFYSLPQGERREKENLTESPLTLPSPAGEEGRKREDERKNFKRPLTLPSPAKWRGNLREFT
jgi:hypothetical protein